MKNKSILASVLFVLSVLFVPFVSAEENKPAPPGAAAAPSDPALEQLKAAAAILRQQRDTNAALAQDFQAQLQLVAAELEAVKKQLAEAQAKVADLTKPKEKSVADPAPTVPAAPPEKSLAKK